MIKGSSCWNTFSSLETKTWNDIGKRDECAQSVIKTNIFDVALVFLHSGHPNSFSYKGVGLAIKSDFKRTGGLKNMTSFWRRTFQKEGSFSSGVGIGEINHIVKWYQMKGFSKAVVILDDWSKICDKSLLGLFLVRLVLYLYGKLKEQLYMLQNTSVLENLRFPEVKRFYIPKKYPVRYLNVLGKIGVEKWHVLESTYFVMCVQNT